MLKPYIYTTVNIGNKQECWCRLDFSLGQACIPAHTSELRLPKFGLPCESHSACLVLVLISLVRRCPEFRSFSVSVDFELRYEPLYVTASKTTPTLRSSKYPISPKTCVKILRGTLHDFVFRSVDVSVFVGRLCRAGAYARASTSTRVS